jgi:hypothetical protein
MGGSEKCSSLWGLYPKNNIFGCGTWHATQFCIDQTDTTILPSTSVDQCRLMAQMGGFVPVDQLVANNNEMKNNNNEMADDNTTVPTQLLGGGEHFDDVPEEVQQVARRRYKNDVRLPRERLAEDIVQENNYRQPRPRGTK